MWKTPASVSINTGHELPLRTARDYYLVATEHALQGRYREALPLLQKAIDLEPQSFWAWCALGITYDGLSLHGESAAAYSTAYATFSASPSSRRCSVRR